MSGQVVAMSAIVVLVCAIIVGFFWNSQEVGMYKNNIPDEVSSGSEKEAGNRQEREWTILTLEDHEPLSDVNSGGPPDAKEKGKLKDGSKGIGGNDKRSDFSKGLPISMTDVQALHEQIKGLSLKQRQLTELSETSIVKLENLIYSIQGQFGEEINKAQIHLEEIENCTESRLTNLTVSINNTESRMKDAVEGISASMLRFENLTNSKLVKLNSSLEQLLSLIEEDLKPKSAAVDEQLTAIQEEREKADRSLEELKKLVDERIFPNTFNKAYAVVCFFAAVVMNGVLICLIYNYFQRKVKVTEEELVVLRRELTQIETKIFTNEVPGRM